MKALTNAIDRFCYKHPNFGISNLMMYIVIGNLLVYVMDLASNSTCTAMLYFSRYYILQGEIWRLVTYVFVPTNSSSVLWMAISLYFYYFVGSAMERQWGSGKFTIFYLSGMIINIIFGMIVGYASAYYIHMSMFFALATLFPNVQFLLLIIPVKAKWLAWLNAAYFIYNVIAGTFPYNLLPLVAILNYLVFFGGDLLEYAANLVGMQRQNAHRPNRAKVKNFQKEARRIQHDRGYLHKCAVCGKTDTDYPDLEFRYCSRCQGYYCYCMEHINAHVHISQ